MFLSGKAKPNFGYLKFKAGIVDAQGLKKALQECCAKLDFKQLANDVAPLVFIPGEAKKVELFPEFVQGM